MSPYAFQNKSEARCGLCRRLDQPYVRAAAYGSYEGGLRELIHMLKYQQVRPAANVLGRMLAEVIAGFQPSWGEAQILVVPVPLYAGKFRQRGFNQAELIARAALKLTARQDRFALEPQLLARIRETQSQIGLTRHQRRENLRGAFAVTEPGKVSGREILLVDDVFTTGTTASECSRVLRKAGASRVWVATVARTLKHEVQAVSFRPEQREETVSMSMAAHG
jgi:ComF family protein